MGLRDTGQTSNVFLWGTASRFAAIPIAKNLLPQPEKKKTIKKTKKKKKAFRPQKKGGGLLGRNLHNYFVCDHSYTEVWSWGDTFKRLLTRGAWFFFFSSGLDFTLFSLVLELTLLGPSPWGGQTKSKPKIVRGWEPTDKKKKITPLTGGVKPNKGERVDRSAARQCPRTEFMHRTKGQFTGLWIPKRPCERGENGKNGGRPSGGPPFRWRAGL